MSVIGNLLWLPGGLILWLGWAVTGMLWCVTLVGIPVGKQCFKLAGLSLFPFGKDIVSGRGLGSLFLNILWLAFGGLEIALVALIIGAVYCVTIIGVPFGMQCFKIARLALFPFGSRVR